ncbi:MAG: hypothetical protein Q4G04_01450 [bacterium]|nr:hypothetical protein [bacterium]
MDLTKLNNEFAEIQKKLQDYDVIKNKINQNIKRIEKELLRIKDKTKNEKNNYLKKYYELLLINNNEIISILKSLVETNEKQEVSK